MTINALLNVCSDCKPCSVVQFLDVNDDLWHRCSVDQEQYMQSPPTAVASVGLFTSKNTGKYGCVSGDIQTDHHDNQEKSESMMV